MAITRSSIIKSPARIALTGASTNYGGATSCSFFSKEDMTLKIVREQFEIKSSAYGVIDKRDKDVRVELDFTPDGQYSKTVISYLWPYANGAATPLYNGGKGTIRGTPIWPLTTDYTAQLNCGNGDLHIIQSYAITKMPNIKFSAIESLIGQATLTGLRATSGGTIQPWSTGSSLFTTASTGGTLDDTVTPFTPTLIKTQPYFLTWGSITDFASVESEMGFDVSFDLKLGDDEVNSVGVVNKRYDDCQIMLKFKPIGPSAADLLAAASVQGTNVLGVNNVVRGQSNFALASTLTLVGADTTTYLTIPTATLIDASYGYGAMLLQNGEIGFVGSRNFSGGLQQALYTLNAPS